MENHISKNWPVWLVIGAMGFSFHWVSKSWNTGAPLISQQEMNYEMPRPEGFDPGYDLSGRKIVRTFDRNERTASLDGPQALRQPMSPAAVKKAPTAPKKTDAKKTAQNKNQKKKSALTTRVIPASNKAMSESETVMENTNSNNYYGSNYVPPAQTAKSEAIQQQQENKVSAAQWRELLFSSPTTENADKFLSAYRAGKIDVASFYGISDALMSDSNQNRQQAGLHAVKQDSSATAFTLLVKHYNDSSPVEFKTAVYAALVSYGTRAKLPTLSRVLDSNDEKTVTIAAEILGQSLNAQANNPAGAGDRGGIRAPGAVAAVPASQFKVFLPSLQRLASSGNASLAQTAQSLLAQIQALTTA